MRSSYVSRRKPKANKYMVYIHIGDVPMGKGTELEKHGCWGKCLIDMGKPARVVSVKWGHGNDIATKQRNKVHHGREKQKSRQKTKQGGC